MILPISSVLLLGTESILALPVIRTLGAVFKDNVSVHCFSECGKRPQKYSRYISSHQVLSSENLEVFFQQLIQKKEKIGPTVILPVAEKYVRLLSLLKPKLQDHFYLPPLPETATFDSLVNKYCLHALLEKHGFASAATLLVAEMDKNPNRKKFFPGLLKPVNGSSGNGIMHVTDQKDLDKKLPSVNPDMYILQELVPGLDVDCSVLAEGGVIKALTIQKGLKSSSYNSSTIIKFEYNHLVHDAVERLMKITGYSGLAHLDFRIDERDGQAKLIDFNPRFWRSLSGSRAAGVDFVHLSCLAALDIPFVKPAFREIIYLMGRSAFNRYREKLLGNYSAEKITTDIAERMRDPVPEGLFLLQKSFQR